MYNSNKISYDKYILQSLTKLVVLNNILENLLTVGKRKNSQQQCKSSYCFHFLKIMKKMWIDLYST